jgi:plastocyanin
MPRSYTIEIDCHNGDLEYSDPHLRVQHGDTIKWICKDLSSSFAIHIGWGSPLAKGRYRAGPGGSVEVTIPPNSPPGCYKYTVALYDGKDIWTDDPDFIIRD